MGSSNRIGGSDRIVLPSGVAAAGGTYSTNFAVAENPFSEKTRWSNGGVDGKDWNNIQIVGGVAYGTQSGNSGLYDDSVASLGGVWGNDQTVTATVKTTNQNSTAFCEVELWVRGCVMPHWITGYETAFRCTHDGSQYIGIVRWDGPLGIYTPLPGGNIAGPGLVDGDTIKVTIVDNVISAYINGAFIDSRTDSTRTIKSGNPGFGHWYRINGAVGTAVSDHGLTSFSATAY